MYMMGYKNITKLETRLRKWIKETDDPFETGEREPVYSMLN